MKKLFSLAAVSAAVALALVGCSAPANPGGGTSSDGATWPVKGKTIDLVVGFAPGGVSDTWARTLADELATETGARVQVVNKEGAGTQLAQQALLAAPKDGYTISMINMPAILTYIYTGDAAPFDLSDFAPIASVGYSPNGLVVKADSPYKSIDDIIAAAKTKEMNVGYNGGADDAIVLGGLEKEGGVKFNYITYDGTPDKIQGLLAGDVEFFSGAIGGVAGQIASGDFRVLAQWGPERSTLVPDVPTAVEEGYDVTSDSRLGVSFAAGVPDDIRAAAEKVFSKLAANKGYIDTNAKASIETQFLGSDDFVKVWKEQEGVMAAAAKEFK
jgi:tripartite-type tricarboxylate transporter receptor subunit TctC